MRHGRRRAISVDELATGYAQSHETTDLPRDAELATRFAFPLADQNAIEGTRIARRVLPIVHTLEDLIAQARRVGTAYADTHQRLLTWVRSLVSVLARRYSRRLAAAENRMESFKARAGLQREPELPDNPLVLYAVLALMAGAECYLNSELLADHLQGGLREARALVVLTVAISFALAWALAASLRCWTHRLRTVQIGGIAASAFTLLLAVGYHLGLAHFREALETGAFAQLDSLASAAFANPLSLGMHSVLLFLGGAVAFGIAAHHLYALDDPYLGYGRVARTLESERQNGERLERAGLRLWNLVELFTDYVIRRAEGRQLRELRDAERALHRLIQKSAPYLHRWRQSGFFTVWGARRFQTVAIRSFSRQGKVVQIPRRAEHAPLPNQLETLGLGSDSISKRVEDQIERSLGETQNALRELRRTRAERRAEFDVWLKQQLKRGNASNQPNTAEVPLVW